MRRSLLHPTERYWGDLYVLGVERDGNLVRWKCLCSCGKITRPAAHSVVCGATKTCGHGVALSRITHGLSESREMASYKSMVQRCTNRNSPEYHRYGGRGISVCQRWLDSFENFLSDMGLRPEGMTLDRINNSVGYEPTNCRWATKRQQANNTRNNRIISVEGTKKTLAEWARDAGMSDRTLRTRLRLGWEPERALSQPVKVYRPRKR